ncbi:MAG: carbohydrate ABC transporter permease [Thermoanaerobacterium sp.]|nr:carbohydrate ABC transporter permease [Thermoanaerobacterium sp.]
MATTALKISQKIKLSKIIIHVILLLTALCCIFPFILIVMVSFTSELSILTHGYKFIPQEFSIDAYKLIFSNPEQILNSYKTTIIITTIGTIINVLITSMFAYAIVRKEMFGRRVLSFFVVVSGMFSGGLVATYIVMTQYYHLQNTYAVMILPHIGNMWYIFLFRAFFGDMTYSLTESAIIDGANDVTIYLKIILPVSKPIVATVALFSALDLWNEWYQAMLYITKDSMIPLQFLLQRVLRLVQFITANMDRIPSSLIGSMSMPQESLKMAMVVVAAGPMLIVFPFFQKYFVRGIVLGSAKE